MTISIKTDRKTKEVLIDIGQVAVKHRAGLEAALFEVGSEVVNETVKLITTGSKTGRMYGGHQASAPGEAPATRTGKLAKSGDYKVRNWQEMTVGETAEYAKYLEDGTRKMEARPHLIKAIENKNRETEMIILESVKREIGA